MNKIKVFKHEMFGEIRTMTNEKGETFFVGNDVAKALGYSAPQNAIAKHVDDEDKSTAPIRCSASETRVTIINESGLYSLILSSKLEQARMFKRWVTSEVLPAIRKTGRYELPMEIPALRLLNEDAEDTLTATQVAKTFNMTV